MKNKFLLVIPCLAIGFLAYFQPNIAKATGPAYTLNTASTSVSNGGTVPVTINMDTGGNDIVVSRVVIRYNKNLVSVAKSDVDLTGSVFATGNTCTFPSDYSDATLQNQPCQIINVDTSSAVGILSITLAMPSHLATTQPGTQINSSNALIATVNFHAIADIATADSTSLLNKIGGIYFVTNRSNFLDSDMIKDDGLGSDVLAAQPTFRSTASNGDLNGDRKVDGADFSVLHSNYSVSANKYAVDGNGNTIGANIADINGDGYVNGADFSVLHANYNQSY